MFMPAMPTTDRQHRIMCNMVVKNVIVSSAGLISRRSMYCSVGTTMINTSIRVVLWVELVVLCNTTVCITMAMFLVLFRCGAGNRRAFTFCPLLLLPPSCFCLFFLLVRFGSLLLLSSSFCSLCLLVRVYVCTTAMFLVLSRCK